jgi:hypothetical protein
MDRADRDGPKRRTLICNFSIALRPAGPRQLVRPMPLTNWKVLLKRLDQVEHQYATTLHRTSVPNETEEVDLRLEGQRVRCLITDVHKDFITRAGVEVFTVRADEIAPSRL